MAFTSLPRVIVSLKVRPVPTTALVLTLLAIAATSLPWMATPAAGLARLLAGHARAASISAALPPLSASRTRAFVVGLRVGRASRQAGATVAVLAWDRAPGLSPGYLVQRAPAADGPWSIAATLSDGETTWTDTKLRASTWFRVVSREPDRPVLVTVPIEVTPVETLTYDLAGPAGPLHGIVHMPETARQSGMRPVVFIVHGTHGICRLPTGLDVCVPSGEACPAGTTVVHSVQGYSMLAQTLAARGMVAVAIDSDATYCFPPEEAIGRRIDILRDHLHLWHDQIANRSGVLGLRFAGVADLDRVGLIGHSTGADAAAAMPATLQATVAPWVSEVRVRAVLAIAPTDLLKPDPGDVALGVILPGCDMDGSLLPGRSLFDRAAGGHRAQWWLAGANHGEFNDQWQADAASKGVDSCGPGLAIGGLAQRAMLTQIAGDWLSALLAVKPVSPPAWLQGDVAVPRAVSDAAGRALDLRVSYAPPGWFVIDRGSDLPAPGVTRRFADFDESLACVGDACSLEFGPAEAAMRLTWHQGQPVAAWDLQSPPPPTLTHVSLRVVALLATPAGKTELAYRVRLRDTDGHLAEVPASAMQPVSAPCMGVRDAGGGHYRREILTTVRAPIGAFLAQNRQLRADRLKTIELVLDGPAAGGAILVADVGLAMP